MNNNDITEWLGDLALPFRQTSPNQWQIDMSHRNGDYTVTIVDHGNWVSYGSDLIGDVTGPNEAEFYRKALDLNARLNGVHVAHQDDRLVLIRDDLTEDMNDYNLYRSLNLFHQAHEYVYQNLLSEADKLNLYIPDP